MVWYQATHPTWFPAPCPIFVTLQDSACSPAQQMLVGSLILLRPNCEHLSSAKPLGVFTVLSYWRRLSFLEWMCNEVRAARCLLGINRCEREEAELCRPDKPHHPGGALWRDIAWKSRPRLRLNVFIFLPRRSGHEVWASVRKGVTLGKVAAYR